MNFDPGSSRRINAGLETFIGLDFCLAGSQPDFSVRNSAFCYGKTNCIVRLTPSLSVRAGASPDNILTFRQLGSTHRNSRTVAEGVRIAAVPIPVDFPGIHPVIVRSVRFAEGEYDILTAGCSHPGFACETVSADLIIQQFNLDDVRSDPVIRTINACDGIDRNLRADTALTAKMTPERYSPVLIKPITMIVVIDLFVSVPPAVRTVELYSSQFMPFCRADKEFDIVVHQHMADIPFSCTQQHKIRRCSFQHRNIKIKIRTFIPAAFCVNTDTQCPACCKRSCNADLQFLFLRILPIQVILIIFKPYGNIHSIRVFRFLGGKGKCCIFRRVQRGRKAFRGFQRQIAVLCSNRNGNRIRFNGILLRPVRVPLFVGMDFPCLFVNLPELIAVIIQFVIPGFGDNLICTGPVIGSIPGHTFPVVTIVPAIIIIPVYLYPISAGSIHTCPYILSGFCFCLAEHQLDLSFRHVACSDSETD